MNKISIFRVILKNVLVFQNRFGKNDHTVVLIIIYVTDGFDTVFHEKTFCPVKIFNHIALIFKKDRYKNFIFKNKENKRKYYRAGHFQSVRSLTSLFVPLTAFTFLINKNIRCNNKALNPLSDEYGPLTS